jgi:hypothetical protein
MYKPIKTLPQEGREQSKFAKWSKRQRCQYKKR